MITFLGLNLIQWLGILGIPSLFALVGKLFSLIKGVKKQMDQLKSNTEDIEDIRAKQNEIISLVEILMNAQQAQMRKQLIVDYENHISQKYITSADLDEWEHQYQAYHGLGTNGVLDSKREKLMRLPSIAPQEG